MSPIADTSHNPATTSNACDDPAHMMYTYIGTCCREWVLALGYPLGRCGLCGERPKYDRPSEPIHMRHAIRPEVLG